MCHKGHTNKLPSRSPRNRLSPVGRATDAWRLRLTWGLPLSFRTAAPGRPWPPMINILGLSSTAENKEPRSQRPVTAPNHGPASILLKFRAAACRPALGRDKERKNYWTSWGDQYRKHVTASHTLGCKCSVFPSTWCVTDLKLPNHCKN